MNAIGIRQGEGVLALLMAEIIMNSFLLHESADKIEISFPILHAVFPLSVGASQGILKWRREVIRLQYFLDNVGNFLVLENPAIGGSGQKPELWHDDRLIARQPSHITGLPERPNVTIEEARAALNRVEPDSDILADNLLERK